VFTAMAAPSESPRPKLAAAGEWPGVSIVMPVLNEEHHLRTAVAHVLAQEYPGRLELLMAMGPSTDRTDDVAAEIERTDERVRCIDNPAGTTGAGLNLGLREARYDVIVRVDGHAMLPTDYVRVAVETLSRTGADNVGGVMAAEGVTDFQRAVATAMTSRLGVGQARFHVGGHEGPVETVYLGVFRRSALERVGGYDETFLRAQDWELNHRIRSTGGTVWFTPALHVSYRPRSTVHALARQYRDYGRWRRVVMTRHRGTANLRYLAPPLAVIAVAAGTVAGVAGFRPGFLAPLGYAAGVVGGSLVSGKALPWRSRAWLPVVFATMHGSWGVGFLLSPRALRTMLAGGAVEGRTEPR
jgi:cellulose synthase/poly-beta-1,6-N-acetylglucosamine synthase-like glycosyltransferase